MGKELPNPTEKEFSWNAELVEKNSKLSETIDWNNATIKALEEEKNNTEKMFVNMVEANEKLLSKINILEKTLDKFRKIKSQSWLLFEWANEDETQKWTIWWIVKMMRG
jgi:peptidoglycan hydrolase CwlO-like protein